MRRHLLAFAATFLWAATLSAQTLTVKPYVQHGDASTVGERDSKVIAWATDKTPGKFTVEYWVEGQAVHVATPTTKALSVALSLPTKLSTRPGATEPSPPKRADWLLYRADLSDMPLATVVNYRLLLEGKAVEGGAFMTSKGPGAELDFVVFGDNAKGTPSQRRVAYQISLVKPEFIMNVGDNVYDKGRVSEYITKFWPDYCNTDVASTEKGAPLMRSAPYYVALGNHDIDGSDFGVFPDGLAAFYFFHWPMNGPEKLKAKPPVKGKLELVAAFKETAGARFPKFMNYSFDNGPAHFLCLDANRYVNVQDSVLREWVDADLATTKLPWKFVFYHQPGFSASKKHFEEQRMRALTPIFEKHKVDVVFAGHVHNYQRTQPITFAPEIEKGKIRVRSDGHIPGKTVIDSEFDGKEGGDTTPEGIIYIITGTGGGTLHSKDSVDSDGDSTTQGATTKAAPAATLPSEKPADVKKKPGKPALPDDVSEFMEKLVVDKYGFTRVQLSPKKMTLRQIDDKGGLIDEFVITKP